MASILISFDYKQAFDSVDWRFLDKSLEFFGFGPVFRQYIKSMYDGIETAILNNGYLSRYVKVQSGFRQGCVMSPGNFLISLQPLIIKIKQDNDVEGISLPNNLKSMFGLFADDIWTIIKGSEQNLNNLLQHFLNFYYLSGLELNYNKTSIMRIGSLRDSDAQFYTIKPLQWVDGVKILGVYFGTEDFVKLNYEGVLDKMRRVSLIWQRRSMNTMAKVVVINSLILSQPIYKLLLLRSPSTDWFKEVKKIVLDFLWEGKPNKIRYSKLIKSKWIGGLSLVDLELRNLALKASWVPRILTHPNEVWAWLAYHKLPVHSDIIWDCNISADNIRKLFDVHEFWIQVWMAWADIKGVEEPNSRDEILTQIIWLNNHITRQSVPWISQYFISKGIIRIQDIFDEVQDSFYTLVQLNVKYNANFDFLEYGAILAAIPQQFKRVLLRRQNVPVPFTFAQLLMSKPNPSSYLSRLVRNNIQDKDACQQVWQNDIPQFELDDNIWNKILTDVYLLTNFDHLRWFQYRLIHKLLLTNTRRNIFDSNILDRCSFCHQVKETVLHLMIQCPHVAKIWKAFAKWIKYVFDITFNIDCQTIIFNIFEGEEKMMINTMILIIKHYIYVAKCNNSPLKFIECTQRFAQVVAIEKTIAIRQNKIKKHESKWKRFILL